MVYFQKGYTYSTIPCDFWLKGTSGCKTPTTFIPFPEKLLFFNFFKSRVAYLTKRCFPDTDSAVLYFCGKQTSLIKTWLTVPNKNARIVFAIESSA